MPAQPASEDAAAGEQPAAPPSLPAPAAPALNEALVRQAVVFLSDPRVKAADPLRALDFLRKKRIPDAELREAFSRCHMPFPHAGGPPPSATQVVPWAASPAQFYAHGPPPPPPQERSPWLSALYSVTAIVGVCAAVREILRRYVVPVYFPEQAASDEFRRHSTNIIKRQEKQIEDLRATVLELRQCARETSEKVERLSLTMSSTGHLRDLPPSDTAELRDAIRHLSQTVSASAGTPASRSVIDRLQELRGEVDYLKLLSVGKQGKEGNLAYSGLVEESTANGSPSSQRDVFATPMMTAPNTNRKVVPESSGTIREEIASGEVKTGEVVTVTTARNMVPNGKPGFNGALDEEDDFMSVRPAEVEKDWGVAGVAGNTVASDKVSANSRSPIVSSVDGNGASSSQTNRSSVSRPEESDALATARRLFQKSMFDEAENSAGTFDDANTDVENGYRPRRASAPELDLPLSDLDL